MLCILQGKGAIDGTLTLAENEDLINHKGIDIRKSPVISDTENWYFIADSHANVISFK